MIVYVLKMFPRFSETFVLQEILELERRGERLLIVSLRKPDDGRFHEEVARVRSRVVYLPEHVRLDPLAWAASHARAFAAAPATWARCALLALGAGREARQGFLRAPMVAQAARKAGGRHLHAHFASMPGACALFASALSNLPFTVTAHAKDIYHHSRSPRLLRALLRRAATVVTVSDYNRRHLEKLADPRGGPGRVLRIYNSVDTAAFAPQAASAREPGPPRILAVGRLVEKKGFEVLVDACALLERDGIAFQCDIVGKGPEEEPLRLRIASVGLGSRVRLVGACTRSEVLSRLRGAAAFAAPCVVGRDGNRDGLPTVILEAMACGVPVVATPVTGIPEAVLDGFTGRIIPPGDAEALAAALAALLGDDLTRRRLGRNARSVCEERFDLRRNVDDLARVFAVSR